MVMPPPLLLALLLLRLLLLFLLSRAAPPLAKVLAEQFYFHQPAQPALAEALR
jgi:hypothetical protein